MAKITAIGRRRPSSRFAPDHTPGAGAPDIRAMGAILFTCPTTQFKVQHWLDDDEDASEDDYEGITCQACAGVHFVNRKGKGAGQQR
jgi:hypothetical protein